MFNLNPYFKEDVQTLTSIFELGGIFSQNRPEKKRIVLQSHHGFQGLEGVIEQNLFLETLGPRVFSESLDPRNLKHPPPLKNPKSK